MNNRLYNKIPVLGKMNQALEGAPNDILTALLLIAAAILIIIALVAPPIWKGVVAAWIILP